MGAGRNIPAMAVAAWYHEKTQKAGRTVEQVWDEATKSVKEEYVPALSRTDSLPPAEKARLVQRLSSLVGLPASFIEEKNLRPRPRIGCSTSSRTRGCGLESGRRRAWAPLPVLDAGTGRSIEPRRRTGRNLHRNGNAGPSARSRIRLDIAAQSATRTMSALETYLRNDLQFKRPSLSEPQPRHQWLLRSGGTPARFDAAASVAEGMQANPRMRMFWIQGYYDLNTPATGALFSFEQAGLTGDRGRG